MTASRTNATKVAECRDIVIAIPGSASRVHVQHWTVHANEFWMIGGRTGAGKSLVLAGLAQLLPVESGCIELASLKPDETSVPVAGMVFDRGGRLFRDLTIEENISLAPKYHAIGTTADIAQLVARALTDLGLEDVADQYPPEVHRSLHGRVALARTLVARPRILLLDDPLGASDPATRKWWVETIRSLRARKFQWAAPLEAIVLACEDPEPWSGMPTHFAWMDGGELMQMGGKDAIDARDFAAREWMEVAMGKQEDSTWRNEI